MVMKLTHLELISGTKMTTFRKLHSDGFQTWKASENCIQTAVYTYGYQAWYQDGKLHRDVGPAQCDHGMERELESIRGETIVQRSMTSWSLVLCFVKG